jgi:hypothetical protein
MNDGPTVAVITGLAVGIVTITLFSLTFHTSSMPTTPTVPQEQAINVATKDLTERYVKNPEHIKIYTLVGHGDASFIPVENFTNQHRILRPLVYARPDGSVNVINVTSHVITRCYAPYCPIPNQAAKAIQGRLSWIVDLASACKNYPEHTTYVQYVIDATNGEILWRSGDTLPEEPFTCQ